MSGVEFANHFPACSSLHLSLFCWLLASIWARQTVKGSVFVENNLQFQARWRRWNESEQVSGHDGRPTAKGVSQNPSTDGRWTSNLASALSLSAYHPDSTEWCIRWWRYSHLQRMHCFSVERKESCSKPIWRKGSCWQTARNLHPMLLLLRCRCWCSCCCCCCCCCYLTQPL